MIDRCVGVVVFEDVMRLEVTMDDVRMVAIMRRALMEVLRGQQHQAQNTQHRKSDDHTPCPAVQRHGEIIKRDESWSQIATLDS